MDYAMVFIAALAFSGHCAAMCGVFPLALRSGGAVGSRAAAIQGLYHAGKISTYVFLGVIAAGLGLRFESARLPLGLASGTILLLVGATTALPSAVSPRSLQWRAKSPSPDATSWRCRTRSAKGRRSRELELRSMRIGVSSRPVNAQASWT